MNYQDFENTSLDLLMGRLSKEQQESFLSALSNTEKAEFAEKERIFNLVKKTGESGVVPPADLVDRIMGKVLDEVVVSKKRGFMDRSFIRKIAAPTALTVTVTVALALVTSNKLLKEDSLRPGQVGKLNEAGAPELGREIQAEKPLRADEGYKDSLQYISEDQKITQAAVKEQAAQLERLSKEQSASQEKLTGVVKDIVNRIEVADKNEKRDIGAKLGRGVASGADSEEVDALEGVSIPEMPMPSENRIRERFEVKKQILNEQYNQAEERSPVLAANEPVSTFSIDVDTGGYTNIRKLIQSGTTPPTSAVRVEEMINYFDYNYPESRGAEPFSFSYEAAPSPFDGNKVLLKLGIKAKTPISKPDQGWNLVFLVDVSGSMTDQDKLPLLKDSMKVFAEHMRPSDKVSIVTYAGDAGVLLEPTNGNEKSKIFDAINSLSSGGSTNGAGGINAAYELAEKNKISGGVNRVILATDGDFNVGISSFDGLVSLIEEKRKSGITLTTLGVGRGNYNEQNLEQLADKGNGNYFYLDSVDEASRVLGSKLTSNMEMVAKDVKLQIEFNPSQVISYRLVGYDNRKLNNQDFKNDAIDAGEIGAGHTVTAIYELVLAGSKGASDLQPDELRYQKVLDASKAIVPTESVSELAFLKIRYKAPNEDSSKLIEFPLKKDRVQSDFSKTTSDFRFATAVAGFGQVIRGSKYSGEISLDSVREIASGAIGADKDGKRREFLDLVTRAKEVTGKK